MVGALIKNVEQPSRHYLSCLEYQKTCSMYYDKVKGPQRVEARKQNDWFCIMFLEGRAHEIVIVHVCTDTELRLHIL